MKIDESCIDHNTVRLVQDIVRSFYEFQDKDGWRETTLGEISGICMLAEALKEVLKA